MAASGLLVPPWSDVGCSTATANNDPGTNQTGPLGGASVGLKQSHIQASSVGASILHSAVGSSPPPSLAQAGLRPASALWSAWELVCLRAGEMLARCTVAHDPPLASVTTTVQGARPDAAPAAVSGTGRPRAAAAQRTWPLRVVESFAWALSQVRLDGARHAASCRASDAVLGLRVTFKI
jgi:hypothetical protein